MTNLSLTGLSGQAPDITQEGLNTEAATTSAVELSLIVSVTVLMAIFPAGPRLVSTRVTD